MTNAQIQSFMAVVQYQSFSRAAEHLFISQSAVSKNVAQLERDLGYVLIDRTYGSVRTVWCGPGCFFQVSSFIIRYSQQRLPSGW